LQCHTANHDPRQIEFFACVAHNICGRSDRIFLIRDG
jgi:hypothetical protein